MAEFSAPIMKRKFTVDEWRYALGNEPGIKEDNDGTAYDLTFSTGSDEALIGSLTQDSITVVGGAAHWVVKGQRHPLVIPPATSAARTDLIVVRNDPAWGALPTDPTAAAAWVGPCRLYRIAGAEGSGVAPTYDGDPAGVEDEVIWEVTRAPGQSLAQATKKDRRIRTGPNLSAATRADLPNVAPLGSRGRAAGIDYVRELDGQGAPQWARITPAGDLFPGVTNVNGIIAIPHNLGYTPTRITAIPVGKSEDSAAAQDIVRLADLVVWYRDAGWIHLRARRADTLEWFGKDQPLTVSWTAR